MTDSAKPTVAADGNRLLIRVPMTFKRRSGRRQIIVPAGLAQERPRSGLNRPLAVAVARAHRWRALLEEGRFSSVSALGRHLGADPSYVSRLLQLACLAPDVTEAVLSGTERPGLTIRDLLETSAVWDGQRKVCMANYYSRCQRELD